MKLLSLLIPLIFIAVTAFGAVTVTVNGTNHTIPQKGERGWATNVTAWIQDISTDTLQPTGGTFTLGADVNFGTSFGLLSKHFSSSAASVASAGLLRLVNGETINWRNAADSADLDLGLATDTLQFNSIDLADISTAQTLTNKSIDSDNNTITNIVNADVKAAAAIAVNKLAPLAFSRAVMTDGSGFLVESSVTDTELSYVSGVTSAIQTQFTNHLADTTTHGTTGNIVGESDTQTLTNKTLTSPAITTQMDFDNQAEVRFYEQVGNGTEYVSLKSPPALSSTVNLFLPINGGNSGEVLQTDGAGNTSWLGLPSGYRFGSVQTFTANGTWTKPAGVQAVEIHVLGGGGAGGGGDVPGAGNYTLASGGAAGGYCKEFLTAGLGATETITIGAGGTGAAASTGATGGTSSFGSHCSGVGGAGGSRNTATADTAIVTRDGGAGGTASGGDINITGQSGFGAYYDLNIVITGRGASSNYGAGGQMEMYKPDAGCVAGNDATGYGAGGGGTGCGDTGVTALAGGDGTDGIIIVYEYY